jgi:hypothetical protein
MSFVAASALALRSENCEPNKTGQNDPHLAWPHPHFLNYTPSFRCSLPPTGGFVCA